MGIRDVKGENDPCSNMWSGAVQYKSNIWPTREHAIVGVKLEKLSFSPINKIPAIVMEYCLTSYKTKQFGKDISIAKKFTTPTLYRGSMFMRFCCLQHLVILIFYTVFWIHKLKNSYMSYHLKNVMTSGLTQDMINMATFLWKYIKPSFLLSPIFIITNTILMYLKDYHIYT